MFQRRLGAIMPTNELPKAQSLQIPIAGFTSIYSPKEVQVALNDLNPEANQDLRSLYEKMLRRGEARFIIKAQGSALLDRLNEMSPNFSLVTESIRRSLALAEAGQEALSFTPLLLLGETGIGKTHFARNLASLLGTGYELVPMSSLTAGWVLSGSSSQWKNAKPGKVASTLIDGKYANPVVIIDEVDKASGGDHYDPLGALYQLLETETAREFRDEFVGVPVDASNILWITTANDEGRIPKPILNRLNVFQIAPPDEAQSFAIAKSVYAATLAEHPSSKFDPELTQDVLAKLAKLPARDMKKLLLDALGTAAMAGRRNLCPEDIHFSKRGSEKRRIGF